jgi:hypothetical protein
MNLIRTNFGRYAQEVCQRASLLPAPTRIPTHLFSQSVVPHRQLHGSSTRHICFTPFVVSRGKDSYLYRFAPTCQKVRQLPGLYSAKEMAAERDLYSADVNFTLKHGGEITKAFVISMLEEMGISIKYATPKSPFYKVLVDARITYLKQGEYPAVPKGWHTDFAHCGKLGEPTYLSASGLVESYVANFSSHPEGVSNMEYLGESVTVELPYHQGVRARLNEQISPSLYIKKARDGEILKMDQSSLHRAAAAHHAGMRGFIRLALIESIPGNKT